MTTDAMLRVDLDSLALDIARLRSTAISFAQTIRSDDTDALSAFMSDVIDLADNAERALSHVRERVRIGSNE